MKPEAKAKNFETVKNNNDKPNGLLLQYGDEVKVKRSSGKLETGWQFVAIEPNSGEALVVKQEKNGTLRKAVKMQELAAW